MKLPHLTLAGRRTSGKSQARLVQWQMVLAGVLAVQALAIGLLSTSYRLPLTVTYLAKDVLQTQLSGRTVVASGAYELLRVNVAYVLIAMLLITALIALLLATVYRKRYEGMLRDGWQPVRWLVAAVAGGAMLAVLALLSGMHDVMALGMLKGLVVLACAGGLMFEVMRLRRMGPEWLVRASCAIAVVASVVPFVAVLGVLLSTAIVGGVSQSAYGWSLFVTLLVAAVLFAANAYAALKKYRNWSQFAFSEQFFMVLIALTETAFVWQVFAAALHA